ncbi:MAG: HYR domain-containing protein [Bacteroidetes bacterium]|jgi:hypothetical protein|nr:HYR domain-containing protein [Bacteroidota bacterium]
MNHTTTIGKSRILLLLLISVLGGILHGQTGPGGVGNVDGSQAQPRTLVWLMADSITGADGSDVTLWEDISGNNFDFSQPNSSFTPILRTNQLNGHHIVEFSKTNNRIVRNPFIDFPSDAVSAVFVLQSSDNEAGLLSYAITSQSNEYLYFYNANVNTYINGNNDNSGQTINDGNWLIYGHHWRSSDGALVMRRDNQQIYSTNHRSGATITSGGSMAIGGEQDIVDGNYDAGQAFQGNIAEIILFDEYLNTAQNIIIDNYLNEKYGITLTANDILTGNDPTYNFDVVGVGQNSGESHDQASSAGMYLETNGTFNDGDFLMAAHDNAVNDTLSINTSTEVTNSGAEAAWNRNWYIEKTNNPDARLSFDIRNGIEDGQYPVVPSNYVLLYRSGTTGNYSIVQTADGVLDGSRVYFDVPDANLQDGYYTLGTNDQITSPVQGAPGVIWYTLVSGDWDDWETWTLDPSGSLPDNPGNYTPSTSPTSSADKVVILSGRTVDVASDSLQNAELEVKGRLNLTSTSGHDFGKIRGNGRILMSADNFPNGDASHFISEGQGEGTAVYYGSDFDITEAREFYNLEIEMDNSANIVTLLNDLDINGDLHIITGGLQVNDNSATTAFNIRVNGSITIESAGEITVGQGNAYHQLNLKGDITNFGSLAFTNRTVANYTSSANDGVIELIVDNATKDQFIQCNGPSNFYRIEIDKGIDKTYALSITATDASNFNLFGRANYGHSSQAQLTSNLNALGLLRGTVKIGNNVNIPVLNTGGNYNISEAARIWVDGGYVAKTGGTAVVPYGVLKVTSGTFEALVNSGITLRENGQINISGGTINVNQIRTSVLGASHVGGYVQTGGTVNVVGGSSNNDYYLFNLTFGGNVFVMQGGTLNVEEANSNGAILINSDPDNIDVSGGTVNMEVGNNNNFVVTSKAPFWNVNMRNTAGNNYQVLIDDANNIGSTNVDVAAQTFRVLNNLTIESNTHFKTNGENVEIGRDFTIEDDAVYDYDDNTTIFNGTEDATLFIGDITGIDPSAIGYTDPEGANPYADWEHPFYGFTIDKPSDKTLTLATSCIYDAGNTSQVESGGCKNIHDWRSNLVKVTGPFVLESGRFDIADYSVRLYDEITNKGICAVDASPENAYIKTRKENTASTRTVTTVDGAEFGNLRLNTGEGILEFTSDVYIERMQYRHGRIYIGTNNLTIDNLIMDLSGSETVGGNPGVQDMIITDGNASDGGLTLFMPAGGSKLGGSDYYDADDLGFPLGIGLTGTDPTSKYTEVRVRHTTASTEDGYITVVPVNKANTKLNGGTSDALQYYWRMDHTYQTDTPTVRVRGWYHPNDVDGDENNYVPGRIIKTSVREEDVNGDVNTGAHRVRFLDVNPWPGDYTAGISSKFTGEVEVYYSRKWDGWTGNDWSDPSVWSMVDHNGPPASDYPQQGDIARVGYDTHGTNGGSGGDYHSILMDINNVEIAELIFDGDDNTWDPRVYVEPNQSHDFGIVSGRGSIVMRINPSNSPNLSGDYGLFNNNPQSYMYYHIRSNGNSIAPSNITEYPNLRVEGNTNNMGNRILTFPVDITVNRDMRIDGGATILTDTDADGDITVKRNLYVGGGWRDGEFHFSSTGTARTITVDGDLIVRDGNGQSPNNNITVLNSTPSDLEHRIILKGDFDHREGTVDLFTDNTGGNNVILELQGENDGAYTNSGGNTPDLYRIIMNKGDDQTNSFTFNDDANLGGLTSGAGVDKAITLENGTLVLDDANIDFDLTTGDDDFSIPASAGLHLNQGQYTANGNSGILLDGELRIDGANLDMSGGDNFIEYSASGFAELNVLDGSLVVGSQIRRGLGSDVGVLKFTQSGGSVIVGENSAPENNRGVFEILGDGSSFTHTGGDLAIVRQQNNPSIAALYLDPATYNLGAATEITLGNNNTPANQSIGVYSTIPLQNLTVNNAGGNDPEGVLWVVPLTINEDLTIQSGAGFDANGKNLFIEGNLTNNGTYTPSGNTTTFQGTGDQTITGNTTFYNLTKTGSATLELNVSGADIVVDNVLDFQNGILEDNNNSFDVKGHIHFDGNHTYGGTGNGISLNGTSQQDLTGEGSFGRLVINNTNGVYVPIGNQFFISNTLSLENGIFNIGKNLLEIGVNGTIEEASPFSENNMIETNISFTDNGIKKFLPSGAYNFIFPIGSGGKYTPVDFDITSNSSASGSITVKPSNEKHPSINEDSEAPDPEITDADNVLQYHWVLKAASLTDFSASVDMKYNSDDVEVTSPYDIYDYITARILSDGSGNWNKFDDVDKFDEINEELIFDFVNTDQSGVSGEYTAGVDGSAFNGAIPDQVPEYQSVTNGNWLTDATWSPTVSGGPRGAIVTISANDTVFTSVNYLSSYSSTITGTLQLGTSFGHRLGYVDGTGTLYLETGALPAGVYDDFFSVAGGTLEFGGSSSYDILGSQTIVNNITIIGGGERRLPNQNIMLNGDLNIDGPVLSNDHNQKISLKGDFVLTSGGFDAGTGALSTVELNGIVTQTISGDFTGSDQFNNLVVNNNAGIQLNNDIEVNSNLSLTDGIIATNGNELIIKQNADITPAQGTGSSYIDGVLTKELLSGQSFTFPVGDGNENGNAVLENVSGFGGVVGWKTQYHFVNPTIDGYDATSFSAPIETVSTTEYWSMQGPAGSKADITFDLDGSSDVANATSLDSIIIVGWDGSEWVQVGGTPVYTGTASSGTISTSAQVDFDGSLQFFTLASLAQVTQASATIATGDDNICSGENSSIMIVLTGTAPWDIEYSDGSTTFPVTGITGSTYVLDVSPSSTTTYSLVSVSDDNGPGILTGNTSVVITVNDAPDANINVSDTEVCPAVNIDLDGNPSGGSGTYVDHAWSGAGVTHLSNANIQTPVFNHDVFGSYFLEYTVTDDEGCMGTDTVTLHVDDNIPPTVICQNITVYLDSTGNASISYTDIDNGSTDNCGSVILELDDSTFNCADVAASPITVTLTGTDNSANSADCNALITVEDTLNPSITCPGDTLIPVDGDCKYTIADFTSLASVSDNCSGSLTVTQSPVAGTEISGAGTVQTVTITVEDENNKTSQCSFDIELTDTISPTITCPADVDTICADSPGGTAVVNDIAPISTDDNCSATGDLTVTYSLSGVTTGTGSDDASGETFNIGVTTVTYTVTDEAGRTGQCSFDITVNDLPDTGNMYRLPNQ